MSTVPESPAGLTAWMCLESIQVTLAAGLPPKLTDVPPLANSEPKMSTVVPPSAGPCVGEMDEMWGSLKVNCPSAVAQKLEQVVQAPYSCPVQMSFVFRGSCCVPE